MSPRRRKVEDVDLFAALVRVMLRRGPAELTLREIAAEAGLTAGALVQRFGSKRALLLAHARHAAANLDIGFGPPAVAPAASPLQALRAIAAVHARMAESPRAALRNLAYLHNDLADPVLRRHLLKLARAARARYERLVAAAMSAGELRPDTNVRELARTVAVTLDGSFLAWTLYREGPAAARLGDDLDAALRPVRRAQEETRRVEAMSGAPCVISVADHTGWAHVVCVAASRQVPAVVARRRVTLIDPGLPAMPYEHESVGMTENEADALLARVRRSIRARAALALKRILAELSPAYAVVAIAIRKPPFPTLPRDVAAVRRSYRLQCAADGMLYQLAMCHAAVRLGLEVHLCARGDETAQAAQRLGVTPAEIEQFVSTGGRPAGSPWTQDHRRAYAAGIAALALCARGRLRLDAT